MALTAFLEKLGEWIKEMLLLVHHTEQNRTDIKDLQQQLTATREIVRDLAYKLALTNERMQDEIKRLDERAEDELEKTDLRMIAFEKQIENQILRARLKGESSSEGKGE